jgi:hypothetical protein
LKDSATPPAIASFGVAARHGVFCHALGIAAVFGRTTAIGSACAALFAGRISHLKQLANSRTILPR